MSHDVFIGMIGGCVCGVFSTLLIIAIAFAIGNKKEEKPEKKESEE